jgi:hypothetical protein
VQETEGSRAWEAVPTTPEPDDMPPLIGLDTASYEFRVRILFGRYSKLSLVAI